MDQTEPEVGIKIYTASTRKDDHTPAPTSYPSSRSPGRATEALVREGGRKRWAVAEGVQKTLSKTTLLANFLPTGTLLTFEMLLPSASGDGSCSPVNTHMIRSLLSLCSFSCFFFHFTDGFKAPDGKTYYGLVTPRGLSIFRTGPGVEVSKDEGFKVGISDFVHVFMSVIVFMVIAMSGNRVTKCSFPGHAKEMDEVIESLPLMVGMVCSGLFLAFRTLVTVLYLCLLKYLFAITCCV